MHTKLEDIPKRIFLDSSTLQTLQTYGGFLYENEPILPTDTVYKDPKGIGKLKSLKLIMQISERAPFEFVLSNNSLIEVKAKRDPCYLQWAYDVLDHWLTCLAESSEQCVNQNVLEAIDSNSFDCLSTADRILLKDALKIGCDVFLTMENKLPKLAAHINKHLGIRVLSPVEMWDILKPWAALFR